MSKDSTSIELTTITCVKTSEPGSDEVYIRYSSDGGIEKRFPSASYHSMSPGDTWSPDLPITFSESAVVALYDNDKGNDDFLGSHTYYPSDPQPETVPITNTNGASYKLSTTIAPATAPSAT